jgi:hypothetical protein
VESGGVIEITSDVSLALLENISPWLRASYSPTFSVTKWAGQSRCFGVRRTSAHLHMPLARVAEQGTEVWAALFLRAVRSTPLLWRHEPTGAVVWCLVDGHGRALLAMAGWWSALSALQFDFDDGSSLLLWSPELCKNGTASTNTRPSESHGLGRMTVLG